MPHISLLYIVIRVHYNRPIILPTPIQISPRTRLLSHKNDKICGWGSNFICFLWNLAQIIILIQERSILKLVLIGPSFSVYTFFKSWLIRNFILISPLFHLASIEISVRTKLLPHKHDIFLWNLAQIISLIQKRSLLKLIMIGPLFYLAPIQMYLPVSGFRRTFNESLSFSIENPKIIAFVYWRNAIVWEEISPRRNSCITYLYSIKNSL